MAEKNDQQPGSRSRRNEKCVLYCLLFKVKDNENASMASRRVFKSGSKLKEVKRVKWDRKDAYGNIVIPYTIAADYVDQAMENLSIAMKRIEDHTCIRFTKRKNEKYYVKIVNEKGGG
ncbi:unnamed protein product [Cylicostephanus goldi]|uniref:Peptidase M12A domain-containing protein n=1 Tax=Cylicostephanus goldi TaxID=71465 RepID=A0A3P6S0G7_CYLGO|nr:unnamed protein product [Cylicostephanus goldi]